jgi:hypothetical protein
MDLKRDGFARFFLMMGIILGVTYLLSRFIGLSRTGFESSDVLNLQTFYLIGGIFALTVI